jgi:hypothetical protein
MLHAADSLFSTPTDHSSVAKLTKAAPATLECVICHIAGHAQATRPTTALFVNFDNSTTVLIATIDPVTQGATFQFSSRAPPAV